MEFFNSLVLLLTAVTVVSCQLLSDQEDKIFSEYLVSKKAFKFLSGKNKAKFQSLEKLQNSSWTFWHRRKQADFYRSLQHYRRTQPKIPWWWNILRTWIGRKFISQHWRTRGTTNRIVAKTRQFYWRLIASWSRHSTFWKGSSRKLGLEIPKRRCSTGSKPGQFEKS